MDEVVEDGGGGGLDAEGAGSEGAFWKGGWAEAWTILWCLVCVSGLGFELDDVGGVWVCRWW